jgi:hypothetical protein
MSKKTKKQDNNTLEPYDFFPTTIYKISKLDFYDELKKVSEDVMSETKKYMEENDIVGNEFCDMSGNLLGDERIRDFANYVISTAENILEHQGYDLSAYEVGLSSVWLQEHHKYSDMAEHVHGREPHGEFVQLVGFYFLDVVNDGSVMVLHDPRPGKVITDLPLKNPTEIKNGNDKVFIKPENGDLIFTNNYLPHSFTRNLSDKSVKFLHINIVVKASGAKCCVPENENIIKPNTVSQAEVI